MEQLEAFSNYITIHNGNITVSQEADQITVQEQTITITGASEVQVTYSGEQAGDFNVAFEIASSNIDFVENYELKNDISYHKTIHIGENCAVARYVTNTTAVPVLSKIQETVTVEKNATVSCAYVEFADSNIEAKYHYDLVGEQANVKIRLAGLAKEEEKKKYEVSITHLAPYTTGLMENFGIVKDKATLKIDGIGTIKQGNRQSDNQQLNKILVFNPGCIAEANPYLYIDEFDVNAGHGASVGKIDEEQLYYLQSRGVSRKQAMHLVTYGYFTPILEFINNEQLKEQFSDLLKAKVGL